MGGSLGPGRHHSALEGEPSPGEEEKFGGYGPGGPSTMLGYRAKLLKRDMLPDDL